MKHVVLISSILALCTIAHADPRSNRADALFQQGRTHAAAGRFAEACAAFDASQKLAAATTTLFNQADCREKNGQLATAWRLFLDAERMTRNNTDNTGARLHSVAVARASKLEPRLSKLTIRVADRVAGLVIERDRVAIDPDAWNRAQPVDGGTYTLVARIGARDVWSTTIEIPKENGSQVIDVVLPRPEPATTAVPSPRQLAEVRTQPEQAQLQPRPSPSRPLWRRPYVWAGVAAVVVAGSITVYASTRSGGGGCSSEACVDLR